MPAYYRSTLEKFLGESPSEVVGKLALANSKCRFPLAPEQINAWKDQVAPLAESIARLRNVFAESASWQLLIEYPVPRLGKRADAIVLAHNVVIVLEFKTGASPSSGVRQVEEYALLLSNFHEPSRTSPIVPITITPGGKTRFHVAQFGFDLVRPTISTSFEELPDTLLRVCGAHVDMNASSLDGDIWDRGLFRPIPSIVEAAVALYSSMDVFEIGHACAARESLSEATDALCEQVLKAKEQSHKSICFVTGVPGAGKTLVGLNAIHRTELKRDGSFLSGNGPLIRVIREALVRDVVKNKKSSRVRADLEVQTFIHNVHRFADENFDNGNLPPSQNVIIFDEAQRAWDASKNFKAYKRKISEPEMILQIMNRHEQWSVIVALVGGGQEIHDGEAGLAQWGEALKQYPDWRVIASPEVLSGGRSVAGFSLFEQPDPYPNRISTSTSFHLPVSVRSFRSQQISDWVNAVLTGDADKAKSYWTEQHNHICYLTRDLVAAKTWLREKSRGFSRCGLVGSANASRLRFDGLEPSFEFHSRYDWDHWFLDNESETTDIRASWNLEVFATQFEIQGLELDWVGLCWGDDLVWTGSQWKSFRFVNTGWKDSVKPKKHFYRLNAYRVLMIRARQGLIIYVPRPPLADSSRLHAELDQTSDFLVQCGATPL